jgi:hypothetical protein
MFTWQSPTRLSFHHDGRRFLQLLTQLTLFFPLRRTLAHSI